jgi:hypothetical protein
MIKFKNVYDLMRKLGCKQSDINAVAKFIRIAKEKEANNRKACCDYYCSKAQVCKGRKC